MSSAEAAPEAASAENAAPPRGQLARLQLAVATVAAAGLVVAGLAIVAVGPLEEFAATLRQHDLTIANDAQINRYANALAGAYDVVSDDFEAGLVSFEFGARPTTTDGRVIGLPSGSGPAPASPDEAPRPGQTGAVTQLTVFQGGIIRIPAIGLNQSVGEGVSRDDLKLGPGHYPGTALPGQVGNAVISGHRTTYSRPFHDLDLLQPGDEILIDMAEGTLRYVVSETLIVSADNAEPLRDTTDARLTLTTCHPKGSARERLVVVAMLDTPLDVRPAA